MSPRDLLYLSEPSDLYMNLKKNRITSLVASVCLLAMAISNASNIAVNRKLTSWSSSATLRCCQVR